MTIARYYVERLPLASPPSSNTLIITAPNPWTWALVRGATASGVQLTPISLTGGTNQVSLVVPVSSTNLTLVRSRYEIILGDASSSSNDAALRPVGQAHRDGAGVTLDNATGYLKMDRDPPPPPQFDWGFEPVVTIT